MVSAASFLISRMTWQRVATAPVHPERVHRERVLCRGLVHGRNTTNPRHTQRAEGASSPFGRPQTPQTRGLRQPASGAP